MEEARSGALAFNLGVTLARVAAAFAVAMILGTALGLAMGRAPLFNRLVDPWLIVLLNLPALVIIVLAYVWAGLTDTAAIAAVALNKLPIATGTVREGARALDPSLDEMAMVFRMGELSAASSRRPAPACALSRSCPWGEQTTGERHFDDNGNVQRLSRNSEPQHHGGIDHRLKTAYRREAARAG